MPIPGRSLLAPSRVNPVEPEISIDTKRSNVYPNLLWLVSVLGGKEGAKF